MGEFKTRTNLAWNMLRKNKIKKEFYRVRAIKTIGEKFESMRKCKPAVYYVTQKAENDTLTSTHITIFFSFKTIYWHIYYYLCFS